MRRWAKIVALVLVGIVVTVLVVDGKAGDWLGTVWQSLRSVSLGLVVLALALQTLQTLFTAVAWRGILRYAYPNGGVRGAGVLACYSTGVALNGFLPANVGTLVTFLMFVATIGGATVVGVLAASVAERLFFVAAGIAVVAYLFIADGGSVAVKLGFATGHPWVTALVVVGVVAVVVVVLRLARRWLRRAWQQAKRGGRILSDPRAYLMRVFAPQFLSWCFGFGVVAVMLAAYGVPVGFHTVLRVIGGNSVANLAAVTPGGFGVNQALNVASLHGATSSATAGAYSIGQQLLRTSWNVGLAIVFLAVAFGWARSRLLVERSYRGARQRLQERPS